MADNNEKISYGYQVNSEQRQQINDSLTEDEAEINYKKVIYSITTLSKPSDPALYNHFKSDIEKNLLGYHIYYRSVTDDFHVLLLIIKNLEMDVNKATYEIWDQHGLSSSKGNWTNLDEGLQRQTSWTFANSCMNRRINVIRDSTLKEDKYYHTTVTRFWKIQRVVLYILVVLQCFGIVGCWEQPKASIIKNPELLFKNKQGKLTLEVARDYYTDSIYYFTKVQLGNKIMDIDAIIDTETFDLLHNFKANADTTLTNNEYYGMRNLKRYYKDKNALYRFTQQPHPMLLRMGLNYKLLGGAYLEANGKIYCRGEEVKGVDVGTFHIYEMYGFKEQFPYVYGLDKNYIYARENVMTVEEFDKIALPDLYYIGWGNQKDSLRKKYFK